EVRNIEDELKAISRPPEASIRRRMVDQPRLRRRLLQLSRRGSVERVTRFKYLLAHASPSARINMRLATVFKKNPALYANIMRYFRLYRVLPRAIVAELIRELRRPTHPYPSISADILETLTGRVRATEAVRIDE